MAKKSKLTTKQALFVQEYVKDFNATKASIRAGYSSKTAYSIGSENLTKPEIKSEIKKVLDERALTSEQTIKLMTDIAGSSLNDYFVIRKVEKVFKVEKP